MCVETCRACVRSPEERWLGHGQGDALFLRKRGETLRQLSSASSSSSLPCWIMLKVSSWMIHASVRAYLLPRGLSTSVRSALFVNRAPFLDALHDRREVYALRTRSCYLRDNHHVYLSLVANLSIVENRFLTWYNEGGRFQASTIFWRAVWFNSVN